MFVGRTVLRSSVATAASYASPAMVFSSPASEGFSHTSTFGPSAAAANAGASNTLPPMGKRRRQGPVLQQQQQQSSSAVISGPPSTSTTPSPVHNESMETTDISIAGPNAGSGPQCASARLNPVRNSSLNLRASIPPASLADLGKLAVILDVDETLIHSRLSSQQEQFRQTEERKQDAAAVDEFTITLDDGEVVRVNKRPGLDKFLVDASQKYELFAYTAGLEEYARPLLDWLDPHGTVFKHRLYRDSCLFMRGYYLKDLQKVNRPLARTVLVDNNAFCFLPQLSNGVPISSFYDDPNDTALQVLLTFLDRIQGETDVRPFLQKSFNLETLLKEHREQIVG